MNTTCITTTSRLCIGSTKKPLKTITRKWRRAKVICMQTIAVSRSTMITISTTALCKAGRTSMPMETATSGMLFRMHQLHTMARDTSVASRGNIIQAREPCSPITTLFRRKFILVRHQASVFGLVPRMPISQPNISEWPFPPRAILILRTSPPFRNGR